MTIPAGASSASFAVSAVDDTLYEGTQAVKVTASAAGFAAGSAPLSVTDDDVKSLNLTLDSNTIAKNAGAGRSAQSRGIQPTSPRR